MGDKTGIAWTDATWNPVSGCTKVSPGCAHCYAETVADRFWAKQYPEIKYCDAAGDIDTRPRQFTDVQGHPERMDQPLRWKRPRRVFVNSMSDLFHEDVSDGFIDQVFAVMALASQHTFQVLTKRPERMLKYMMAWPDGAGRRHHVGWEAFQTLRRTAGKSGDWSSNDIEHQYSCRAMETWPLPNVWLGVSVENQHFADERIPLLLQTPAAVRFISAEPLLGPVDLSKHLFDYSPTRAAGYEFQKLRIGELNWVIIGGESGRDARECQLMWIRALMQQCRDAGVPVFVKQLGAAPRFYRDQSVLVLRDRKGADPAEWPDDLRVQEYPM